MRAGIWHKLALGAFVGVAATTAAAQDPVQVFSELRADLFADVCMSSAPTFEGLQERAIEAGFVSQNGRLSYDDVTVGLKPNDAGTLCACQMTMFAPDFPLLLVTVVDRLREEFPDYRHDDSLPGKGYSAIFQVGTEEVIVELSPERFKDHDMLVAWVVAQRGCPV